MVPLIVISLALIRTILASPTNRLPHTLASSATCTSICVENCPNTCPLFETPTFLRSAPIEAEPIFNTNYRSTIEIVWSCLSIIFACTWVCVHPNVTGYNTTTWQRLWRRLKLFAMAIFAPELLAVFAYCQWKGCRKLHKAFKERAEELGIPLELEPKTDSPEFQRDEGSRRPLSADPPSSTGSATGEDAVPLMQGEQGVGAATKGQFKRLLERGGGSLASLRRALRWYKVNPAHTAWTLTHAHFVQMGGIVFIDPHGGGAGFKDPWIKGVRPRAWRWNNDDVKNFFALRLSEDAISDKGKGGVFARTVVILQVLWFVTQTAARAAEGLPVTHLEVVCLAFTVFNVGMYLCWWDKPLDLEHPLALSGIPGPSHGERSTLSVALRLLVGAFGDVPVGRWTYSANKGLHPSLHWCGEIGNAFFAVLALTSSSFGALHALGWHVQSPSEIEGVLWRISCLVLISYPFLPFLLDVGVMIQERYLKGKISRMLNKVLFFSITGLGTVAYVAARLLLLVFPIVELRSLPPLAYQTVSWSNFLPHF